MANVFVSYNRQSESIVRTLVDDIEALGHTAWFDHELSGGQAWWDEILAQIRGNDFFVLVMDPASLDSTACRSEYGYADALGKPVLPILVSDAISTNLLPAALSRFQYVDYVNPDREAAFRLARAITALPPAGPLPDPLPEPPEAPISYLGSLSEKVDTAATLGYEEQCAIISDLRRSLRDPETADDGRVLLEKLRRRRDLFATNADEIDELLKGAAETPAKEPEQDEPAKAEADSDVHRIAGQFTKSFAPDVIHGFFSNAHTIIAEQAANVGNDPNPETPAGGARRFLPRISFARRLISAAVGGAMGNAIGLAAMSTYPREDPEYGLLTGAAGAIVGALGGANRRVLGVVLKLAALGWLAVSVLFLVTESGGPIAAGGVFGAPAGAIIGLLAGLWIGKRKGWFPDR